MMGLPRRYAPRNDKKNNEKRVFEEFYLIFIILQRPIIYLM